MSQPAGAITVHPHHVDDLCVVAPAPAVEPFSGPVDASASVETADRTGDRRDSAPAPGDRSLDLIAGAPDLDQRRLTAPEGWGQ